MHRIHTKSLFRISVTGFKSEDDRLSVLPTTQRSNKSHNVGLGILFYFCVTGRHKICCVSVGFCLLRILLPSLSHKCSIWERSSDNAGHGRLRIWFCSRCSIQSWLRNSSILLLKEPIISALYLQAFKWQSMIFNCVRPFCHISPHIITLPTRNDRFLWHKGQKNVHLVYRSTAITKTERISRFVCKHKIWSHVWAYNVVLHKPIQVSKTLKRCL